MNDSLNIYESIAPLERGLQVRLKINSDGGCRAHWHEHIELLYFLSGEYLVSCGEKDYPVHGDELIIINSNERHSAKCHTAGEYICMHISPQFFADVEFDDFVFYSHISEDDFIKDCFENMLKLQQENGIAYDMRIKSVAYALMAHLVSNYRVSIAEKVGQAHSHNRLFRINDIFFYISSNYMLELSTAELAEHFHLTEQYFCRMFKKATGMTPINYINRYRAEKAAVFLKNTDQSITDIAFCVGFDDPNYFSRTFKKHMGVTPRQYRQNK